MAFSLSKSIIAALLAVLLVSCFTFKTTYAQQVEQIEEEFQALTDEIMFAAADHPAFEMYLDNILEEADSFAAFEIESDDALVEYMATLSDAEALFFKKAFRGKFIIFHSY